MGKPWGNNKVEVPAELIRFLDRGDKLEGTLELGGTFRIESEVKGTVRCKNRLIIGEHASIEGEIEGAIVTVAGKINGNVRGSSRVEILPGGIVRGEVYTPYLVMHPGGVLDGQSHMPAEATAKPIEVAQPLDFVTLTRSTR